MAPPTHPVSDATITAHTKLRFDSTGDPYLPIRPVKNRPKSLYHLTPLYPADLPALVATLNHPAVWPNLCGSPFPYSMAHAEQWLTIQEERTSSILGDLGKGHQGGGCPVLQIRAVETGEWAGDISATRWGYPNLTGSERDAAVAANDARAVGDPALVWTVGYYLAPSAAGQGLMSSTLRTLILDYLIPVLHVHKMYSSAFTQNLASKRVLEICGFREVGTFETVLDEGRGGGVREQWHMEWRTEWMGE